MKHYFSFTRRLVGLLLALLLLSLVSRAQSYQLPITGRATYTTCAGTLYDDGGPTYPHDGNANGGVTLLPGTAGAKLKLDFSYLEVDSVNTSLYVYDGPDTNSPLIERFRMGHPTVYATGSTGALTVVLSSYGYPLRGFAAAISCVTSAPPLPDLAALSVNLPVTLAPAGDNFSASARIGNLVGALAPFRLRYLLSTDRLLDAGDVELARLDNNQVAGTNDFYQQLLTVPAGTAPGPYYVLAAVQLLGAGYEANTTNNVAVAPFTVPALSTIPDLTITALKADTQPPLTGGSVCSTTAQYQNLGQPLAPLVPVGYYLSTDATLSPDDQLVGTTLPGLPTTGRSLPLYQSVYVPPGTTPGKYYLLCVADYLDQIIEANEHNNVLATPLTIGPPTVDLTFAKRRSALPTQVGAGGTLTVTGAVQNIGSISLDSAAVGYYLSADRELSADDAFLGHSTAGPLYPGDSYYGSFTSTLPVPPATPLGRRYLLLVADYLNRVAETDKTNNVATLALDVLVPNVDLTVTAPRNGSIDAPVPGNTFYSRCTLANLGSTVAYPATVGYYLSADNQLSADDKLLGQTLLLPLAGGVNQVVETPFALPAGVAPGAYYLLFVADYLGQVAETNETNNVAPLAIRVLAPNVDLAISFDFSVKPARAGAGTVVQMGYYLQNLGTTAAYTPITGFYLSTDNLLSADDIFLSDARLHRQSAIYPASYGYFTTSLTIPRGTAPGQYYMIGVADYLREFADPDRNNNIRAAALEVTAARPDLTFQNLPYVSPKLAAAGSQVATESYLYNVGASQAGTCQVGYYLSADPVLSANDVLLGSTTVGPTDVGYTALVTGSFLVPATTASGRYYVLFVADYRNQTNDSDLTNNLSYTTLTVTAPLAAREQLAGYELSLLPVPVARPAPLRVQLGGNGPPTEATLTLYTMLGQPVTSQTLLLAPGRGNQAALPTAGLAPGVYVLRLAGPTLYAVRRVVVE